MILRRVHNDPGGLCLGRGTLRRSQTAQKLNQPAGKEEEEEKEKTNMENMETSIHTSVARYLHNAHTAASKANVSASNADRTFVTTPPISASSSQWTLRPSTT
eukprot:6415772-Pyramimonas_sp.AAC.1